MLCPRKLQLVLDPDFLEPGAKSPALFFKWEVRTGSRCAPKGRFKPSDNCDSCTIEAKFAAQRGVCSAEHAFWAWLPFLTAQNLGERVENARHLWKNQGTRGIKIAISPPEHNASRHTDGTVHGYS